MVCFHNLYVHQPTDQTPVHRIGLVTRDVLIPGDNSKVFFLSESQPRFFRPLKIGLLSSRFSSGSQQIENSTSDKHFRQELKGVKIGVKKVRNSGIRVGHVGIISGKTFTLRFGNPKGLGLDC